MKSRANGSRGSNLVNKNTAQLGRAAIGAKAGVILS